MFLPANKAVGVARLYEENHSCCREITWQLCNEKKTLSSTHKIKTDFKLTLTKESKVPSSMSLAAFLSPRAKESIAPENTKKYVTVSDLENISPLKSEVSCVSRLYLKCYIKKLHGIHTVEVIYQTRQTVFDHISNTAEKVFGNVVKHCLTKCLEYLLNRNYS